MANFYANPYNQNAVGFFFGSLEELEKKSANWKDRSGQPVEEYAVEFIEGAPGDSELFQASGITAANIDRFFQEIEDLADDQRVSLFYLMSWLGMDLNDALDKVDEPSIYQGLLVRAADEVFDECYLEAIPVEARPYIDYEAFARDQQLSGAMTQFEFAGEIWTCTNADSI